MSQAIDGEDRVSETYKAVVGRIRRAIRRKYPTDTVAAEEFGWYKSKLSRVLSATTVMRLDEFVTMCKALGVSADRMLGLTPADLGSTPDPEMGDVVAVPSVGLDDLEDDVRVLNPPYHWHIPRGVIRSLHVAHGLEILPDWERVRHAITDVPSDGRTHIDCLGLVDRQYDYDQYSGLLVVYRDPVTGSPGVGRCYSLENGLNIVRRGQPPLLLRDERQLLGVVLAVWQPVAPSA